MTDDDRDYIIEDEDRKIGADIPDDGEDDPDKDAEPVKVEL